MSADQAPSLATEPALDAEVEEILAVFAQEARIERNALRMDARADELGANSLDLALAIFELEARFGVTLPEPAPGDPMPTVGEMVQQVLDAQRAQRSAHDQPGAGLPATPTAHPSGA
ncbi:MAG: acyl carrier protein [Pseudomonadota bacterium]|nr:acyl carrier protein [Pseudomonadota bacterium]